MSASSSVPSSKRTPVEVKLLIGEPRLTFTCAHQT